MGKKDTDAGRECVSKGAHMKKKKETGVVFKKTLWVLATLYMLTACTGCARNQTEFVRVPSSGTVQSMTDAGEDPASQESRAVSEIYVHVCGAVKNAGVYKMTEGDRVFAAIEAAGGFLPDAAEESINQARVLADGEELYIPTREEILSSASSFAPAGLAESDSKEQKVNINTADVSELTTLTGIGETRARAIIAWREQNGDFSSPEDLKNVEGIADKTYEKIKDRITVN